MVEDVAWDEYSHGKRFGMRYRQLGEFGGCKNVGVCMEELAPRKQACTNHYHHLEEETAVSDGRQPDLGVWVTKAMSCKAGSYVVFPAGQQAGHSIF
ncbi:hypothetical protein EJG51_012180 [Undibacterium piscinae]|uniref:Uncharacterized protein n=1 Tax=Undibacterium piscinae TaxID=2495591 RepID=A0A6M4A7C9_9BURK|nr:hypothetical protein EJG51_012180 [Undibacterium piscinae]